ncbi:MAG: hypothetical protein M5U22_13940 [Thermoleophilia bacterium]|nr:hypothetical protein [Thermoleophilia bacterium]
MPYDVPVENVDKVLEAKTWYETYYAHYPEVAFPPLQPKRSPTKVGGDRTWRTTGSSSRC